MAVAHLHRQYPHLRVLSDDDLRVIFTAFLAAGWTWRDITHAVDYHPTRRRPRGHREPLSATRTAAAGWIRRRMQSWHTDSGDLLPSVTQRTRRVAAERAQHVDPTRYTPPRQCAGYQAIRALLAAGKKTPADDRYEQVALLSTAGTVTPEGF